MDTYQTPTGHVLDTYQTPIRLVVQGLKVEGVASAEWQEVLSAAQAMVKQHQGNLASEATSPAAAQTSDTKPGQQALEQPISQAPPVEGSTDGTQPAAGDAQATISESTMQKPDQEQADAALQKPEAVWLSDMLTGCMSMLLTIHKYAEQPAGSQTLDVALANSLRMLQPHAASNQAVYRKIEQMVSLLRNRLLQA